MTQEVDMTAINTNTAALNAQFFMSKANKEMESAMTKLSSGKQVNSAADDAAGLAISSRMTSQLKGLSMAIKNAGDTVSLAQTAEGALEEVTNMLQRIRELAVQSANGTMNDSDRASLDAEVQALKTEIDRVASTTSFNNRALLDGTFSANFQIGHEAGQTVGLKISSVETKALGMSSGSGGTNSIVGGRITNLASFAEGDIKINGQDVGAFTAASNGTDVENVLDAINNNVDNVEATAFNVVVAKQKGDGVTTVGQFQIEVEELGVTTATTFSISASNSMDELVANINAETGGVVAASLTEDGKMILSNETGATIKVTDSSATGAATFDGGSGFGGTTQQTFAGFIRLSSLDGSSVQIERGNLGLSSPGTETDLDGLGFRENTRITAEDHYTVTGLQLTDVTTGWGKGDLNINGVEIYDEDIATTSISGRLEAINNFSDETGVSATAYFEEVFDMTDSHAGTDGTEFTSSDLVYINGQTAAYGATLAALVTNINLITDETGVSAEAKGQNLILKGSNVAGVTISVTDSSGDATAETNTTVSGTLDGNKMARIRLDSLNNLPISIMLGDDSAVAEHGFLEQNVGAADYQVNDPTMSASGGSAVSGLSVATSSGAENALATLDNAINSVNEIRGDLGAIQNRLEYTINNLSSISNATEGARGRIVDADYAKETSALTKQQILSQAATSMLAQANQSKQSVLALLQS
jgi:flagellin